MILLMFILDLALICAAGKCMYHFFHLPDPKVEASERKQEIVTDSQKTQKADTEEKARKEQELLKKQAADIYSRNREILIPVSYTHLDVYKRQMSVLRRLPSGLYPHRRRRCCQRVSPDEG